MNPTGTGVNPPGTGVAPTLTGEWTRGGETCLYGVSPFRDGRGETCLTLTDEIRGLLPVAASNAAPDPRILQRDL